MSAGERPQTYALDRAATGTGGSLEVLKQNILQLQTYLHLLYGFYRMANT